MKQQFLLSIKMIYPDGVENKHHWRDIIKIYFMGYVDSLRESCLTESHSFSLQHEYDLVLQLVKPMTDFNWWPDDSWRWW